jgi:hypothetical protein
MSSSANAHVHPAYAQLLSALEHLLGDPHTGGLEDQVDQDLAVPGLEEPLLGRLFGAHPRTRERLQRPLGLAPLHHQVDVVARRGAAAGPAAEAAAEQVGDVLRFQGRDRALEARGHRRDASARPPVYNISQPVLGEAFWRTELAVPAHSSIP